MKSSNENKENKFEIKYIMQNHTCSKWNFNIRKHFKACKEKTTNVYLVILAFNYEVLPSWDDVQATTYTLTLMS